MNNLVNKFFHSVKDEGQTIEWQGRILEQIDDKYYLVQLYSWMDGSPTDIKKVTTDDMKDWLFYNTDYKMRYHYYIEYKKISLKEFKINEETAENIAKSFGKSVSNKKGSSSKERNKITDGLRYKILRRDGFECVKCGSKGRESELEVDHIIPISKEGKTIDNNLQTLCKKCNSGKSNGSDK